MLGRNYGTECSKVFVLVDLQNDIDFVGGALVSK